MWWLAHGELEIPEDPGWLSAREVAILATMRFRKRYIEFLTRRYTAKRAIARMLEIEPEPAVLGQIEIGNHPSGAPYVIVGGRTAAIDISISDRAGWAVCLTGAPGSETVPLGIDLELAEPRSKGFVTDFFTAAEQDWVFSLADGDARDEAANLIWSAKEAALKVLKVGLRADTRDVEVVIDGRARADGWAPMTVTARNGTKFPGWWRRDGVFLLTIASTRDTEPPALLPGGSDLAAASPVHSWLDQPLV